MEKSVNELEASVLQSESEPRLTESKVMQQMGNIALSLPQQKENIRFARRYYREPVKYRMRILDHPTEQPVYYSGPFMD